MVSFAQAATTVLPATTNRDAAKRALANLRPGDGTALGEAIARSVQVAQRVRTDDGHRPPAAILVLSDGAQTQGVLQPLQAAQRARRLKIPVYTVAFGTSERRRRGRRRRGLPDARDRSARPADAAAGGHGDRRALLRRARPPPS